MCLAHARLARRWPIRWLGGAFSRSEDLGSLEGQARDLVAKAFDGIAPGSLLDYHTHVVGLGARGSGNSVNEHMTSWRHPLRSVTFAVYMSAAAIDSIEEADEQYVARLAELARTVPGDGRYCILAFDRHHRPDGSPLAAKTEFHTTNDWIAELSRRYPERFVATMSVHPYRSDALDELQRCAAGGARIVKWLPNAMGIDPADPRCDPYYEKMRELDCILLTHTGEEQAVEAEEDQKLGNPLRLRRPLEHGVKVIAAHCASLGTDEDLDRRDRRKQSSFDLFLRLMDEPRFEGSLFADISAMTQFNRCGRPLGTMLERRDLHPRLVNGSDYPLPAINLLIVLRRLVGLGYLERGQLAALRQIYRVNPLLFDTVVKRTLRAPRSGAAFAASVFQQHRALAPTGMPSDR